MLTLHGFDASNYVNMVKFALREKASSLNRRPCTPARRTRC